MSEIVYGRNATREVLRARRRHIHKLILADHLEPATIIDEILLLAKQANVQIQHVPRQRLDNLAKGHQGVAIEVGNYPMVTIEEVLNHATQLNQPPFILAMDHLEDPHNLGAILRTAEIVGIHGVILPSRRSADITPTVVNVSAGAVEHILIVQVSNLVQTLKNLKKENVWVVGVENTPSSLPYHEANLSGAIALVIGNEGKGISHLVKETCDFLIKINMRGQIESLNASVAAGLALYEAWRARQFE